MDNAKDKKETGHVIFVMGTTGSGKTAQFLTLPGRKFIYLFDPNAINTLKGHDVDYEMFYPDNLKVNIMPLAKAKPADKSSTDQEPMAYVNFYEDFGNKLDSGFFDDYDVIGFDSITTLQDLVMDRTLYVNGHPGKWQEQDDWTIAINTISNLFRTITSLEDKIIYVTGHLEFKQDDVTKRMLNQPVLIGRLRQRLPLLFSEVLVTHGSLQGNERVYEIQTMPDKLNPTVRTSFRGIDPMCDVTIEDWDEPGRFGLGKIIKDSRR